MMTTIPSRLIKLALISAVIVACSEPKSGATPVQSSSSAEAGSVRSNTPTEDGFEEQVQRYLQLFPYQDTYKYVMLYTQGDRNATSG